MNKKILSVLSILLCLTIILSSCAPFSKQPGTTSLNNSSQANVSELSSTEKPRPQDDYYLHINKEWIDKTKLSNYVPQTDRFSGIANDVYTQLFNNLIEEIENYSEETDPDFQKVIKYFITSYDTENRNLQGTKPIQNHIDNIKKITSIEELQKVSSDMDIDGIGTFMMFSIHADIKDSLTNRLYLSGPVLTLEDKSYYTGDSELSKKTISSYETYIKKLLTLAGESNEEAEKIMKNAFEIEKNLAESTLSKKEKNEVELTYNKFDLNEFSSKYNNFKIKEFLERVNLVNPEFVIVTETNYYDTADKLMTQDNLQALKDYMYVQLLAQSSDYLSSDFIKASRDFVNELNGTSGYRPAEDIAFFSTEELLGEILGRMYVKKYFTEEAKEKATNMVENIISNYKKRIQNLDWMTDQTKSEAIKKLDNMTLKIGYPDNWTDYTNLQVDLYQEGGSAFQNYVNYYNFSYETFVNKLDQPVDKSAWNMTPHTPNAYYSPSNNEIVFPAAILQAPFFDVNYTESQNYGGIGTVIAHEISHAFDDNGRKFDEYGNHADWWTEEDLKNYKDKTQALIDMFDKVEIIDGHYIDGELTLDENIADLGGVSCIVDIVKNLPDGNLEETFESYANIWASKSTQELVTKLLTEDSHSPNKARVNVILSNINEFHELYNTKEGDLMYVAPENRIKIW